MATSLDDPLPDDGIPLWDRAERDTDGTGKLGIYFGANPAWDYHREFGEVDIPWVCDLATREVMHLTVCSLCRSGYQDVGKPPGPACANCMASAKDDRLSRMLAGHPVILPDTLALQALAVVRADLDECDFVRGIEVGTSGMKDRANVVVVTANRRLKPHERLSLPKEVDGVRVEVVEPGKRKQQGDAV